MPAALAATGGAPAREEEQEPEPASKEDPEPASKDEPEQASWAEPDAEAESEEASRAEPEAEEKAEPQPGSRDGAESDSKVGSGAKENGESTSKEQSEPAADARQSDLPSKEEVDEFLKKHEVDENASETLRDCPPAVQRKVLDRGDLKSGARSASAVLLVRIRDARTDMKDFSSTAPPKVCLGLPSTREIDEFVKEHNVNDAAAAALRSASPTMKRNVLNRAEFREAQDVSSLLLSRISSRSVPSGGGSVGKKAAPLGGDTNGDDGGCAEADAVRQALRAVGASNNKDVEEFIRINDVDVRAAAELRECSAEIQKVVLARGDLKGSAHPSSELIGRIREAKGLPKEGVPSHFPSFPPGYPPPFGYPPLPPPGFPGFMPFMPAYPPGFPAYPPLGPYAFPPPGFPAYPPPAAAPPIAAPKPPPLPKAAPASPSYSYSYSPSPAPPTPPPSEPSPSPSPKPRRKKPRHVSRSPSSEKERSPSHTSATPPSPPKKKKKKKGEKKKKKNQSSSPSRVRKKSKITLKPRKRSR